ncbi:MAG TPA: PQQ-dependent sugar dehydrogenase [Gaiellaceae bacterium]
MRALGVLLCALALLAVGCSSGGSSGESSESGATPTPTRTSAGGLGWREIASGLDSPLGISSTPSEPDRLYIVEQPGEVRVLENGKLLPEAFLDVHDQVVSGGEQGLLSLAFDRDYASNHLFYVDYTDTNGDTRVVEFEAVAGSAPVQRRQLLFVDQPYPNHNGGQLAFGPDGRLYVGMGDGGSGGDPENRAQDLSQRLGKLLSLDPHGSDEWRMEGYGLRNPWRFSFDRENGDLWIGDVGQGSWEEIDHTPRSSPGLENYGWDVYEGTHIFEDKDPNPAGHLVMPVYEYSHDEGCSVTGGFVYRGEDVPAATGRYFFGDYCSGTVWSLVLQDGKARDVTKVGEIEQLSSFGEDAAGELYAASLTGKIFELVPG